MKDDNANEIKEVTNEVTEVTGATQEVTDKEQEIINKIEEETSETPETEEKTSIFLLIFYGIVLAVLFPILGTIGIFKGIASMDVNEVKTHPIEIILGVVFIISLIGFIVLLANKKKK